jgi:choline dehydrogenase-like flavoprotein
MTAYSVSANRTLQALVDRIIPADDYPSGWQAGVGDFIAHILATDLRSSAALVEAGLVLLQQESRARHAGAGFADLAPANQDALIEDLLAGKTIIQWADVEPQQFALLLIQLTTQGYYSDPENGGNRDGVAWEMIGYRALPPEADWPPADITPPRLAAWDSIAERYDAIVVGAGAGGGIAACVLAEAGKRVLLVERGTWLATHDLRQDHLHNHRVGLGYDYPAGPPTPGNPRVFASAAGDAVVPPTDMRWHNNAMTVGGGTRVYGAQSWRFCPEDFRMASIYAIPEKSSLADWPISYADLEPDYDRAEWELGVAGDPAGNKYAGPRRRGYPMPPLRSNAAQAALTRGALALDLSTSPVPLLINSVPYNGRGACINCGACVGFGCPGEFKTDTRNTVIPRAIATGRCDVLVNAQAERISTDAASRVIGVALVTDQQGAIQRCQVYAEHVLLGAGAIETARLLLNSGSTQEPNGIGNNSDQVGRNLQGHVYAGTVALFDEIVQDCIGPGPRIATNDFRHDNKGLVGGAMIANDFVPLPLFTWGLLSSLGAIPPWGAASKQGMRRLYSRTQLIMGPVQEVPNPESRVTLDPQVRDKFGVPVARLSGSVHPEDRNTAKYISEKAVAWALASGAKTALPLTLTAHEGPSASQHQAGTCRMGTDPTASVTDAWGAVWGHENLHIVDGSLHVTNGGVNPVLTIMALAYRVSQHVIDTIAS